MIDPEWQLVDLDPRTWRVIGEFFDPGQYIRAGTPDEHALFVLHDDGQLLSAVDTRAGRRGDLDIQQVTEPAEVARRLYGRGEWDRVHVINRTHLEMVAARAQDASGRQMHLDAYYRRVYHLIWGDDEGYVALPPRGRDWNGWTYDAIEEFIGQLQEPSSLALGVVDGGDLAIGLVGEVSEGMIRKVTTFEALPGSLGAITVSVASLSTVWAALEERFHPPAAAMLCTRAVFDAWINLPQKVQVIREAIAAEGAVLRLDDNLAKRCGWEELTRLQS
jgi:hypothetical protein